MRLLLLLGLGGALLAGARPLGSDSIVDLSSRSLPQCANDSVWLQFQGSSLQAQASAFCSAYIGHTVTKVITVYPTTTRTEPIATITDTTIDITVTDFPTVIDTVTLWYSSSAVVPVTITSVIEDIVPVTDFITTTDATAISTSTDVVTTSVTDTTVTSTIVSTEDITTTDATVYATQTSILSMTITDVTVTNTVTSFHTVTTTASLVQRDIVAEDEEDMETCPAPEPECTSPECLYSSWLNEVSTIATRELSSACSCLVVPATTTSTLLMTGSLATRTITPSVFATATGSVTAVKPRTSSHVVLATTVVEETSRISLFVTETVTSPTTKYIHAAASSSAVVTRVVTEDEAVGTTITSIDSVIIDETASATITLIATATIHETASTTVSVTETVTATASPTSCASLPNPYYDATTGRIYELECGYEYSYSSSKLVGIELYVSYLGCIDACSSYSTCAYVQYDRNAEECFLLSAVFGGQAESAIDVAHVVS